MLVHAIESDDVDAEGRLAVRDMPPCLVRERITQSVSLITETESEDEVEVKPTRPPGWLIDAVYRRGSYGGAVRPLSGIVESPTIRVDGSIVQTPGYDPQTGLIFRPSADFPAVPDETTKDDAAKALSVLLDVLADFPMFEDADRSAWASMVLSMIGRSCVDGYVPLFAVTANIRGAGKSLLVDAATLIAYGRRAARKAFTRDDDEMRKTITAVAIGAVPSVLFDNLDIQLGGAALDAAITSATWSDRVLGQSRMTGDLPMRTTALAGDDTAALLGKLIAGIEAADPSGIGLTVKEIQAKTFGRPSGLCRTRSVGRGGVRDLRRTLQRSQTRSADSQDEGPRSRWQVHRRRFGRRWREALAGSVGGQWVWSV